MLESQIGQLIDSIDEIGLYQRQPVILLHLIPDILESIFGATFNTIESDDMHSVCRCDWCTHFSFIQGK